MRMMRTLVFHIVSRKTVNAFPIIDSDIAILLVTKYLVIAIFFVVLGGWL